MPYSSFLTQLFATVGEPTPASVERIERYRRQAQESDDSGSFSFVFDLRPGEHIFWHHNATEVLGLDTFSVYEYLMAIHPEFVDLFAIFTRAVYRHSVLLPSGLLRDATYTYNCNIPLRRADGRYSWFKMMSKPAAFDRDGHLSGHYNRHYPLADYPNMLPERPVFTLNGIADPPEMEGIVRLANAYFTAYTRRKLSAGGFRILAAYRAATVPEAGGWRSPEKGKIAAALQLKVPALERATVRLLKRVRCFYPAHAVRSVTDLCRQLNEMFGCPRNPIP